MPDVFKYLSKATEEFTQHHNAQPISVIEKMRYDHAIDTKGDDLKINNNYSASYARLLMVNNSELIGFFETRKSKADDQ